ncbi:hypothetical protein E3E38_03535 [Thermococcus sp. 18S1]|uniref:hypothetical protein n=1 Tax=Thermococcus sp. 18S1 TaxID=1638210 RepID=UPI001439954D|nr:hypothetical protein [Thermococcus sp. 18S1]NJE30122.1 hypothetical protein [Thermococcus sp. 18S1]
MGVIVASSCEGTVKRIAVGLILLYLTGFLILYYAIRKLICLSADCSGYSGPFASMSPVYGLDMAVAVFVVGTLFLLVMLYLSFGFDGAPSENEMDEDEKTSAVEDRSDLEG